MAVPGPAPLGRSVVVGAGDPVPEAWADAVHVAIDARVLDAAPVGPPPDEVERLHRAWAAREPVVIRLLVDPGTFRPPVSEAVEPWRLDVSDEPWADRLHFLVWANSYDARGADLVWWWGRKAARCGGTETPDGPADVRLPDGRPAWVDGGPRRPWAPHELDGHQVVAAEDVDAGTLTPQPGLVEPTADLAPDQLAAVAPPSGPARVIAPAGSGKTRVLTERLRHLLRDRSYLPANVVGVAYNKAAQLELEARTADVRPHVRTLNSLGLWVLTRHRGHMPPLIEERDVRRLVDALAPVRRQRRSNTDPIGPYVESLATIRLGLRDPAEVEAERDDVPGLAELFPAYRQALADRGAVDFDDQVYAAIETLLADGPFRRELQATCRHLLVDEFQDLTPAHLLLVRLLALPELDVFGVGDDDQVIYGHASADPAFLIDYAARFPGAADHPLTVNYRCPVEVVDGARHLLGYNHRRVPKEIHAGPSADHRAGALSVVRHRADGGARAAVEVVQDWLADAGVVARQVAVLARVNSLLLAPHVALHQAAVPVQSVLGPDVLERTGLRAALAYVRIAASPESIDPDDIVEILRRPTRGLAQWFPDRLHRRSSWRLRDVRGLGPTLPDKERPKLDRLVDDLEIVCDAGRSGTTREVLLAVRDGVGLGSAMTLLDRTGAGQGSSHLDDLEGLLQVADLHPDVAGFEEWLRARFRREADTEGVTLSTIHRVKGKEWDRVAVFGVTDGLVPHRLADDVEEERRVLHVAITRAAHRATLLVDETRPSPFLDELAGTAPHRPPDALWPRGDARAARVEGRVGRPTTPEVVLDATAADLEVRLKAWRSARAKSDGVPAYVVLNDKHLRGIAAARPATPAELIACDGIGPTKLENYGDEILALVEQS